MSSPFGAERMELAHFPSIDVRKKDRNTCDTPQWFALYTRSRHEKFVNRELGKKGIETFLPLRKITRRWSDRRKIVEEPLFPGYLFVHTFWGHRMDVLNTMGAVFFVGASRIQPLPVPEQELWSVRRFIEEQIQVDPYPYLKEGVRVCVRSGSLYGVEGFIVRKDKHCRLVVSLDLVMQSVSVEIDAACVEVV